jgi:hypothetical protein
MPVRFVATTFCQVSKGQILKRHRRRADAGIVEQDIEAAEGRFDCREQRHNRLSFRHVGRHSQGLRAERVDLAGNLVEHLFAPAGKDEVVAGLGQRNGHCPAHAGSCPGHQRDFCGSHRMSFLVGKFRTSAIS